MTGRTLFKGISTSLITILLLYCGIELFVRILHPQPPINIESQHTPPLNRGHFTIPGIHPNKSPEYSVQVHVNQFGFVDHEWTLPAPSGTLLIGDSFVQAAQVDLDLGLGRLLQQELNEPVMSMGVPGAGTTTTLLLLKSWIPKIRPKRVFMGILVSNDIMNNHPELESKTDKPFALLQDNTLAFHHERAIRTLFPVRLLRYSQSILWLERRLSKDRQVKEKLKHSEYPVDYGVYLPEKTSSSGPWEDSWLITERLLIEIQMLCESHNVELYFLLFPSLDEISTKRQSQIMSKYPSLESADFSNGYTRLTTIVHTVADSHNRVIDLYPDFLAHSDPNTLYFPTDGHWTEQGHALAAHIIGAQIAAQE